MSLSYALVLLVLVLIFLYLVYYYSTSTFDFWKKLKVPYVKPLPLIGNFPLLSNINFLEYMKKLYFQYPDNEYFGIWIMRRPTLVVKSPDLVKRILVKDFDHFYDRTSTSGDHDPWGKYNVFSCQQPIWSEIRKKLTPVFSGLKLKSFHSIILEKSKTFTGLLETEGYDGLYELCGRYATDVVTETAFGIEANTLQDKESILRVITKNITDSSGLKRRFEIVTSFYLPEVSSIFRTYSFSKFSSNYFTKIYKQLEDEKKTTGKRNDNILDALTKYKGEVIGNSLVLSDDIIVAQGVVFLFAAVESSATMILMTLLELTHSPDIQERLFEEIDAALDKNGRLDYQVVNELTILDQCVKETLRKYPIIATIDRKCMKDYEVNEKFTIPKGTSIIVNLAGLHHDPKYFPNPTIWNPERFNPENEITPFTYMPFGEGPRNCIGLRNATLSLKTVLATILAEYELKKYPNTLHPNELTYPPFEVFPHPKENVYIRYVKRNKNISA